MDNLFSNKSLFSMGLLHSARVEVIQNSSYIVIDCYGGGVWNEELKQIRTDHYKIKINAWPLWNWKRNLEELKIKKVQPLWHQELIHMKCIDRMWSAMRDWTEKRAWNLTIHHPYKIHTNNVIECIAKDWGERKEQTDQMHITTSKTRKMKRFRSS